jgi:hypothetical protein
MSLHHGRLPPNGLRYAPSGVLVGGMRQRHFDGTNFKPRKLPDCPKGVRTLRGSSPTTIALVFVQGSSARCTLCWAAF